MWSRRDNTIILSSSMIFLTIIKLLNDYMVDIPQILQFIMYGSLPFAGGLITLSFCSLLGTFPSKEKSLTSIILMRTSEDGERNFFVGFFAITYFVLLRPVLASNVTFLPYVEWVTTVLAVYAVYSVANHSTKGFDGGSESAGWKGHIQKVSQETGQDLRYVVSLMEEFVAQGVKEPLLIYLALHLQRVGKSEEDIFKTLDSLINYKEKPQKGRFRLASSFSRRKPVLRGKEAREELLKKLTEEIIRL